jgi:creatinine amidohydrolase
MEKRIKYLNHIEFGKLVPERFDTVLLPVGTVEAHGVIPLGTDILIPDAMAERIAREVDLLVAPTIPYGITHSLYGHPGSLTISDDVFEAYVYDVVESLANSGFRKVIVLNGHGGQINELQKTLYEANRNLGVKTLLINWWFDTEEERKKYLGREGGHAASDEMAPIMAIDPSLVKQDLFDEEMITKKTGFFSAYPFPGSIIVYSDGDWSLNFDEGSCRAYFGAVTEKVIYFIKDVLKKWQH